MILGLPCHPFLLIEICISVIANPDSVMNITREERWWLVSMSHDERAEILADGEHPPERAIAAVAVQEHIRADRLHSPVARFGGETDDLEVVVRRR